MNLSLEPEILRRNLRFCQNEKHLAFGQNSYMALSE